MAYTRLMTVSMKYMKNWQCVTNVLGGVQRETITIQFSFMCISKSGIQNPLNKHIYI